MNKSSCLPAIFFALSTLLFSSSAYSQSENPFNRWNLKLGYSRIYTFSGISTNNSQTIVYNKAGQYQLSGSYHPSRYFAAGIYTTFASFPVNSLYSNPKYTVFSTGLKPELILTPILFPDTKTRFDISAGLKAGIRYVNDPDFKSSILKPTREFGVGGGLAWYPWQRINIYCEYYYGKQANRYQKHSTSFGLGFRF